MWSESSRVDAFEEMYRRCYPHLVELCRRYLFRGGDPEAVAQEAFVRAWRSLDRFSGVRPFWPWLATIARRLCVDSRRRLDRETSRLYVQAVVCGQQLPLPEERVEIDEECRSALRALDRLKPSERHVITLRELNGWSYDEIARFEGVSVESIRGSLKRARASLRRTYATLDTAATAQM
jgi:RNA polymerase sigma-70 factor (ECF subfamily)